jgi:hypothetical protein
MREAKELMSYFTDNPAFKDMMESFGGIFDNPLGPGGGGGKGSQSERLATAKERLRKKAEEKKKAKK